jgi:hypothetical protein
VLTYDDVELPAGRLADRLRAEQYRRFRGETWLEDLLGGASAPPSITVAGAPVVASAGAGNKVREAAR